MYKIMSQTTLPTRVSECETQWHGPLVLEAR